MASTDYFLSSLINNNYPNGVEFEMIEDFNNFCGIIIRCKECKKLELNWGKLFTSELFYNPNQIMGIRNQLVEHAKTHNELVKILAEKLGYSHIKPLEVLEEEFIETITRNWKKAEATIPKESEHRRISLDEGEE